MRSTTPDIEIEERIVSIGIGEDRSKPWPVAWSGVTVGALAAIAAVLLFGLIGIAVGTHQINQRITRWSEFSFWALVLSVAGAFFSFVIGGWVAVKVAGLRRSETAVLHGGIVWIVALPLILVLAALGAGSLFGNWYGGLAGTPAWAAPTAIAGEPDAALVARNSALGAVTALLLGLVGSVLGGWMASGEPMSLTYRRARNEAHS